MKISFYEIKNSQDTLNKLAEQDLPFKYALILRKIIKKINEELTIFEEERRKLIEKYGEKTNDGTIKVSDDKKEDFLSDYENMLKTEVDLDVEKIPISLLENTNISLSVNDIEHLSYILTDEE